VFCGLDRCFGVRIQASRFSLPFVLQQVTACFLNDRIVQTLDRSSFHSSFCFQSLEYQSGHGLDQLGVPIRNDHILYLHQCHSSVIDRKACIVFSKPKENFSLRWSIRQHSSISPQYFSLFSKSCSLAWRSRDPNPWKFGSSSTEFRKLFHTTNARNHSALYLHQCNSRLIPDCSLRSMIDLSGPDVVCDLDFFIRCMCSSSWLYRELETWSNFLIIILFSLGCTRVLRCFFVRVMSWEQEIRKIMLVLIKLFREVLNHGIWFFCSVLPPHVCIACSDHS